MLALGDLLHHGWRIERALGRGNRDEARAAVSQLVGRDTDRLDDGGCRRAAIESLSENLTDGFISPLCWYVAAGIPGLALFKVVSTMDSMVGYKTPRYLRFGWCGARLDDVMNFVPARLTFCLVAATAGVMPGYSGQKSDAGGMVAARDSSRSQRGMERGGIRRRAATQTGGPDLDARAAGHRRVAGRSGGPTPGNRSATTARPASSLTVTGIVAAIAGWVVLQFVRT